METGPNVIGERVAKATVHLGDDGIVDRGGGPFMCEAVLLETLFTNCLATETACHVGTWC